MKKAVLFATLVAVFGVQSAHAVDLKGGGAVRVRHEYDRNIVDLDNSRYNKNNQSYFRERFQLWGSAYQKDLGFAEEAGVYMRLAFEPRQYMYKEANEGANDAADHGQKPINDEIVFDNLYIDTKNIGGIGLDTRIGRQDLKYNDGFLFADGTPVDGSRTVYFNAAKATLNLADKRAVDMLYITQPKNDEYLPKFHEYATESKSTNEITLNEERETAIAAVYKDPATIANLESELFLVYKEEEAAGGTNYRAPSAEFTTTAAYGKYKLNDTFSLRGQYAYQFGDYNRLSMRAHGWYTYLDANFKDAFLAPKASVGYMYLGGDDRDTTGKWESFNPVFGRLGIISDLMAYQMTVDGAGYAYFTNTQLYSAKTTLAVTKADALDLMYGYMRASAIQSGFGNDREKGHLYKTKLTHTFTPNISASLGAEYLQPGGYYDGTATTSQDDGMIFSRAEVNVKF